MSGTHDIRPPRLERFGPKTLTGLMRSHKQAQDGSKLFENISSQWRDLTARCAIPAITYGLMPRMSDGDTHFDYLCCAEMPSQPGFTTWQVPALHCAVFQYTGHVSGMREFLHLVFGKVLPMAEVEPALDGPGVPEFIERYDQRFDPQSGTGSLDILIPLKQ